jgi:hypothetical protein
MTKIGIDLQNDVVLKLKSIEITSIYSFHLPLVLFNDLHRKAIESNRINIIWWTEAYNVNI